MLRLKIQDSWNKEEVLIKVKKQLCNITYRNTNLSILTSDTTTTTTQTQPVLLVKNYYGILLVLVLTIQTEIFLRETKTIADHKPQPIYFILIKTTFFFFLELFSGRFRENGATIAIDPKIFIIFLEKGMEGNDAIKVMKKPYPESRLQAHTQTHCAFTLIANCL